jgi:RHS repeat-associated protein
VETLKLPNIINSRSTQGSASAIPGYANDIDYQLGGMLHRVVHANNVTRTQTFDPSHHWQRPFEIKTTNVANGGDWSTGLYAYDGAGNISSIGTIDYRYDRLHRFLEEKVENAVFSEQVAQFDNFGNLTQLTTGGNTRPLPTSATTNRLTGGPTYRATGALTGITIDGEAQVYNWDGLDKLMRFKGNGRTWVYVYDANDERIFEIGCLFDSCGLKTSTDRWTLRGLGGEVLRSLEGRDRGQWQWDEDAIYRDGQLLTVVRPNSAGGEDKLAIMADHLGSTRQVVDQNRISIERNDFYPFGQEKQGPLPTDVKFKFTGHERDDHGTASSRLDYMHARYCSPLTGRFLAVDPVLGSPAISQSWNRYAYVQNRPTGFTDPTGKCSDPGGPGSRICIEAFIPTPMFGPFSGDNRSASAEGGTFRTHHSFNLPTESQRAVANVQFTPGTSEFGHLDQEAAVGRNEVLTSAEGVTAYGEASDGLAFGLAPDLTYEITLTPRLDGTLGVTGEHTAFPSFEVWSYKDGQPPELLYSYDAPAGGFVEGTFDIIFGKVKIEDVPHAQDQN